jgi:hypothetical protein
VSIDDSVGDDHQGDQPTPDESDLEQIRKWRLHQITSGIEAFNLASTGNYQLDLSIGGQLAELYLSQTENPDASMLLPWIVEKIRKEPWAQSDTGERRVSGIEVGFLRGLGDKLHAAAAQTG